MAYDTEVANRVREALADRLTVREVKMFGGLSFMVGEKMVVSVGSNGDLLVRVDPDDDDRLLTNDGAHRAEMGAGRSMGKGWISVARDAIDTDEGFDFWMYVALKFNEKKAVGAGLNGEQGSLMPDFQGFSPELFTF